jgi:alginate O-acetyltransferase complex protein AlgI
MLFNSIEFLVFFLPLVFVVFRLIARFTSFSPLPWLTASSLFFYGWWEPRYLLLLLGSAGVNYCLSRLLGRVQGTPLARTLLITGVLFNLGLLAFYKYAAFIVSNVAAALSLPLAAPDILLPLAISFFTFQQIAYLADINKGQAPEASPLKYLLFVSFFPQLIAGPIVHHRQLLPQLDQLQHRYHPELLAPAVSLIILGLAKKVLVADTLAVFAEPGFQLVAAGTVINTADGWLSLSAYTLQIYFDFSGYCDIAIGCALLFGIRLPVNFQSPYQSTSIIDYWRRWHITLSNFLRDYVYIPLGGSQKGKTRRYINLFLTMLIGGLWHGAGWTYLLWGSLHGAFLVINHLWRNSNRRWGLIPENRAWAFFAQSLTLLSVTLAFAYFKAPTITAANSMLHSMLFGVGSGISADYLQAVDYTTRSDILQLLTEATGTAFCGVVFVAVALGIALLLPNSLDLVNNHGVEPSEHGSQDLGFRNPYQPDREPALRLQWAGTARWGIALGVLGWGILLSLTAISPFLYFQF